MKAGCAVHFVMFSMCLYFPLTNQILYVNVALEKQTYQKDTVHDGFPRLAVDGNTNPDYFNRSCTHTSGHTDTYWVVDLGQSYPIERINITNRNRVPERLKQFSIYVSAEDPRPDLKSQDPSTGKLCLNHTGQVPAAGPHTVTCQSPDLYGRYVYVWKPASESLTLCQFEVLVDSSLYFSAPQLPSSEPVVDLGERIRPKTSSSFFSSPRMETFSRMACVGRCLLKQRREGSTLRLGHLNGGNDACDWPVIKTLCYKEGM